MTTTELAALDRTFTLAVRLAELTHANLADRGLTTARAELLLVLNERGPTVQRDLSKALRCTPRYITGLVDSLEAASLAERQPHPTDRRATLVALTKTGKRAAARMAAERRQAASDLFGDLPPAQVKAYVATIDHVLRQLVGETETEGTRAGRRQT